MKIAYILPYINGTGGIAKVIFAKINYLIEVMNYQVSIITYLNVHQKSAYDISNNIQYIHLRLSSQKKLKEALTKVMYEKKFDLVISSLGNNEFYFLNSIKDGSKKIAESHSCFENFRGFTSRNGNLLKYLREKIFFFKYINAAKKFDAFVVLNSIDGMSYKKYLKNTAVISNPIIHNSLPSKDNFKEKRIIAVGRLEGVKAFHYLIEAWAMIYSQYSDWIVEIYGEGPLEKDLKNLIINKNIKNIDIKPFTKEIDDVYKKSSILVMTSMFEGQGMVLLEAMYYGLSLLSFKIKSGPMEIVKDKENGFFVEKGNTLQLSEKLEVLINDNHLREKFHHNSITLSKDYELEKIMKKWVNLFVKIIN